jgi:hypothetical protein
MQRHRTTRVTAACALLALLAAALGACGTNLRTADSTELDPATTEVVLHFHDSSVPPPYHRSYVLTVSDGQVHAVVDSYGDVLHDVTEPVPRAEWVAFLDGLDDELATMPDPEQSDEACTGGTSIDFTVNDGSINRVDLEVPNCGSDANSRITDRLSAIMEPFAERVDLAALTSTG